MKETKVEKLQTISKKEKLKKLLKDDYKMKLLVIYLALNLLYLIIGTFIHTTGKTNLNFDHKAFSMGLRNLLILNSIVFFIIIFEKKYKKNLSHLGVYAIIITGIISTMFAVDRNISLYGFTYRYEGLFSILYYMSVLLLATQVSKKYKKIVVNCILFCGLIQAIFAIFQCYNLFDLNPKRIAIIDNETQATAYKVYRKIRGLTGNPNFFGTYMVIVISYSIGLFMDSKKKVGSIIYLIYIAIFMFALLICKTESALVGLGCVLLYSLVYAIKNKQICKFIIVIIVLTIVSGFAIKIGKSSMVKDVAKTSQETTEIAKGNAENSFGSGRIYIWKNTIKIIPNHLIHGAGIDCFSKAFNGRGLTKINKSAGVVLFDKAHNEYLQILVTEGIFALISYLFLYGYCVYVGIKRSFKCKELYLILPILGYLTQAFFNISVIDVAPVFFLAIGLCCGKEKNEI